MRALSPVSLALEVEVQVQDAALKHALEAALVVVFPAVDKVCVGVAVGWGW